MHAGHSTRPTEARPGEDDGRGLNRLPRPRRRAIWTRETKHAFKTTEFTTLLLRMAGILVVAAFVRVDGDTPDSFLARDAWLDVTIVAGAYMVGRGLAKSGVPEHHGRPVRAVHRDAVDGPGRVDDGRPGRGA